MGLHYPGDILGGLILGILSGIFVYWLFKKYLCNYVKELKELIIFKNEAYIPLAGGLFSICMISLCSIIILGMMT